MEKIIETKEIIKEYKSGEGVVRAVAGVNLKVSKGEFVAIAGPSGSGKSTLLYLLGLLEQPTSGDIYFKGEDLGKYSSRLQADFRRTKMGFVFQQYNLLPVLNALENIKVPMMPYRPSYDLSKRARDLLEQVGLSHRAKHLPAQLSGGEQQRVAIARALLSRPELLLADEPTGNMDSKNGKQVLQLIEDLRREYGLTLIMVTHDEAIAARADRIVRINDGLIIKEERMVAG